MTEDLRNYYSSLKGKKVFFLMSKALQMTILRRKDV